MSMKDFIRANRSELDSAILGALRKPERKLNDHEREQWILNDEGLYLWARRSGVKV